MAKLSLNGALMRGFPTDSLSDSVSPHSDPVSREVLLAAEPSVVTFEKSIRSAGSEERDCNGARGTNPSTCSSKSDEKSMIFPLVLTSITYCPVGDTLVTVTVMWSH